MPRFKRSIDFDRELFAEVEKICTDSGTTVPRLVNKLLEEAVHAKDRDGYFLQPFSVVSKRDYERFKDYEATLASNVPKLSSRKRA